jgi:NADPH:quinone reductase-like Zn-dependent oxidoreductase
MQAYELRDGFGLDHLRLIERDTPAAGPHQALVAVRACSINFRDLSIVVGTYNPRLKMPMTPLSDAAGEVVAIGEGTTRVKVGDRVAAAFMPAWIAGAPDVTKARTALGGGGNVPGTAATHLVLPEEALVPLPAGLSFEEAATLPCAGVTAWNAVVDAGNLRPGETMLILGSGGVSLFALQFARAAGARVIALSSSDDKLERLRAMGASDGINYRTTPTWDNAVKQATGGVGVDLVIETGGGGTLARSLSAVRMGGRISLMGSLAEGTDFSHIPILMKSIRLQGILVGSRAMFEAMLAAIELHRIKPVIDRVFAFDELPAALSHMQSGAHFGKIVVRVA